MPLLTEIQRQQLVAHAEQADRSSEWMTASWNILREAGVLARSIPIEYGGAGLGPVELLAGAEEIAGCCLTTAFALSQREAAIRQLLKGPAHLKARYLPRLAAGEIFLTVGLSQLTTSRQHVAPALRATPTDDGGYQLDGEIPWVTGADQATAIVIGATRPDGLQVLLVLPTVQLAEPIGPPLQLAALTGSRTSLVRCSTVRLTADCLLAGPAESVLGKGGGGGLETSSLAIGLSAVAIAFIQGEAKSRPDLQEPAARFDAALQQVRRRLHELASSTGDTADTLALRLEATRLVLRATQAALMVAKGVGFVAPQPVQRWARQAQFFLVWSCPRPVAEGLLNDLSNC